MAERSIASRCRRDGLVPTGVRIPLCPHNMSFKTLSRELHTKRWLFVLAKISFWLLVVGFSLFTLALIFVPQGTPAFKYGCQVWGDDIGWIADCRGFSLAPMAETILTIILGIGVSWFIPIFFIFGIISEPNEFFIWAFSPLIALIVGVYFLALLYIINKIHRRQNQPFVK